MSDYPQKENLKNDIMGPTETDPLLPSSFTNPKDAATADKAPVQLAAKTSEGGERTGDPLRLDTEPERVDEPEPEPESPSSIKLTTTEETAESADATTEDPENVEASTEGANSGNKAKSILDSKSMLDFFRPITDKVPEPIRKVFSHVVPPSTAAAATYTGAAHAADFRRP